MFGAGQRARRGARRARCPRSQAGRAWLTPVAAAIDGAIQLDPGAYWIGDLGYVLSDEDWDRGGKNYQPQLALRLLSGETAYIFMTYGDGNHPKSDGGALPVDSGTVGIVPVNAVIARPGRGITRVFEEPFVCKVDYDRHLLIFGDLKVRLNF